MRQCVSQRAEWWLVLGLLPFLDATLAAHFYSSHLLHVTRHEGLSLAEWGYAHTVGVFFRIASAFLSMRAGTKVIACLVPFQVLNIVTSAALLLSPDNKWVFLVSVTVNTGSMGRGVQQVLVSICDVPEWPEIQGLAPGEQRARMSRMWEACFTVGYCFATLIGGAVYDWGVYGPQRIENCALFQLCCAVTLVASSLAISHVRASHSAVCCTTSMELSGSLVTTEEVDDGDQVSAGDTVGVDLVTARRRAASWVPILVAATMCFVNFAYVTEWCLYALIMSDSFGWSATAAGAAQMAGDLVGALVLFFFSRCFTDKTAGDNAPTSSRCCRFALLPFNMAWLLFLFAILLIMMADERFAVAVVGQVLMGTVYVLAVQVITELNILYGYGDADLTAKYSNMTFVGYASGTIIGTLITTQLKGRYGTELPLHIAATVVLLWGLVWLAAFSVRSHRISAKLKDPIAVCNPFSCTERSWHELEIRFVKSGGEIQIATEKVFANFESLIHTHHVE
jgi:hypothetical protein